MFSRRKDMRSLWIALLLAGATVPAAGQAQAPHSHAAPNGGQIRQIGALEAELVVKGPNVMLYVVDEKEQKVDASKLSATAVVLAKGNEQKTVELEPAKDNILTGRVDFPVEGKFRATVTLRSGSTEVGKGRYNLDVITR